MKSVAKKWSRRLAPAAAIVAMILGSSAAMDHYVESELAQVGAEAYRDRQKSFQPHSEDKRQLVKSEAPFQRGFELFSKEDQAADAAAETARAVWRRNHSGVITAQNLLDAASGVIVECAEATGSAFRYAISYLSVSLRIALGIGFGIALGVWIVFKMLRVGGLRPPIA
jgi:predicted secreted protein